jgi:hypothetical protein
VIALLDQVEQGVAIEALPDVVGEEVLRDGGAPAIEIVFLQRGVHVAHCLSDVGHRLGGRGA